MRTSRSRGRSVSPRARRGWSRLWRGNGGGGGYDHNRSVTPARDKTEGNESEGCVRGGGEENGRTAGLSSSHQISLCCIRRAREFHYLHASPPTPTILHVVIFFIIICRGNKIYRNRRRSAV